MATALEEHAARRKLEAERAADRKRQKRGHGTLTFHAARVEKAQEQPCRVCALHGRHNLYGIEAHHIVHRGRIGSTHPLVHHPDNILPVCHTHHQDHHNTARRIPWAALTDDERRFLVEHGGAGWAERWYPRGNDAGHDRAHRDARA